MVKEPAPECPAPLGCAEAVGAGFLLPAASYLVATDLVFGAETLLLHLCR